MNPDQAAFKGMEWALARPPLRQIKGLLSAYVAYPIAEQAEKRHIREKWAALRRHYRQPAQQRALLAQNKLADILAFAGQQVPYYKDLFTKIGFDAEKVRKDAAFLQDLPLLSKDIIREQGPRLLSQPLESTRHHACKTGGSTGLSTVIYYDQAAADQSAAVTLYCRERIGKLKRHTELHFACRFPGESLPDWPSREDFKCFAMNRSNIFFGALDAAGLDEIWTTLLRRRPHLVHGHPSTLYALACHIEKQQGSGHAFEVFESSGELMEPYQREKIAKVLRCQVVNRYGLAELGVMAYDLDGSTAQGMQVLDSEGWAESVASLDAGNPSDELVFTGFSNHLMPLIRYRTGDLAQVEKSNQGVHLRDVVGRLHDMVAINGVAHATHHIQDVLDHRVGGIQEFQIDLRESPPRLRIVKEPHKEAADISAHIERYWPGAFTIDFVGHSDLVRVGRHAKFRHVVTG